MVSYSANTGVLQLGSTQGRFKTNTILHAVSTNAYATVLSFDNGPAKLSAITVVPDPIDAQPTDDYGYTITIIEPSDYFKANTSNVV